MKFILNLNSWNRTTTTPVTLAASMASLPCWQTQPAQRQSPPEGTRPPLHRYQQRESGTLNIAHFNFSRTRQLYYLQDDYSKTQKIISAASAAKLGGLLTACYLHTMQTSCQVWYDRKCNFYLGQLWTVEVQKLAKSAILNIPAF